MQHIAQILVNIGTRSINKAFSYIIPLHLDYIGIGWRVLVPFGNRKLEGFIISVTDEDNTDQADLKPILDILDNDQWFDEHMMETAKWISEYYLCNLVDAMRLFIPGKSGVKSVTTYRVADHINVDLVLASLELKSTEYCQVFMYINKYPSISSARLEKQFGSTLLKTVRYLMRKQIVIGEAVIKKTASHRYKNALRLAVTPETASTFLTSLTRKPAQARLLSYLMIHNQLAYEDFKNINMSHDAAQKLIQTGMAAIEKIQVVRDSYANICGAATQVTLTVEQQQALSQIVPKIQAKENHSFLLHGITGSGKTQVYIEA
ncbi:MAG: primosomal protein N', partial [Sporomusaceae bacterium]|nr:primosomal protein N' [Sporomusaceae bacterium]